MSHVKCWKIECGTEKGKNMLENTGGIVGFGAILIPTLMGLYYGFRCTFQTDAAIEQWGIGALTGALKKVFTVVVWSLLP